MATQRNTIGGHPPRRRIHYHYHQYYFIVPVLTPFWIPMEDFGAGSSSPSRHNFPIVPPPPGIPIRLNNPMMRLQAYQQYQGASVGRPLSSYRPIVPHYYNSPRYQRSESYPRYRHFQPRPAAGAPYVTSSGSLGYQHYPPARNNPVNVDHGAGAYRVSAEKSAKLSSWLGIDSPHQQQQQQQQQTPVEASSSKYTPNSSNSQATSVSSYEGRGNQGMKPRASSSSSYEPQPQPQQSPAAIALQKQQEQQQLRQRLIQQYDLDFPNLLSTVATEVGKKKQRSAPAKVPIHFNQRNNELPLPSEVDMNMPCSSSSSTMQEISNQNLDQYYQTPTRSAGQRMQDYMNIEDGNGNEPDVDADILRRRHLNQSYLQEYAPAQTQSEDGQTSSSQMSRFNYGTSGIHAARVAYSQFAMDFGEDSEEHLGGRPTLMKAMAVKREFPRDVVTFDVDESATEDPRDIVNFTRPGQNVFRNFNPGNQRDLLRSVFNVNEMDLCNPKEICSRRISQKSIKCWPVDVLGSDQNKKEEWKRSVNHCIGRWITTEDDGMATNDPWNYRMDSFGLGNMFCEATGSWFGDGVGPFGLESLAKCVFNDEGMRANPMGYVAFMGMNLEKVYKDIDKSGPVVDTFAGPFASQSHTLDFSSVEVMKSIEDYDVPNKPEWTEKELETWNANVRLNKIRSILFIFDTLMYIFYSCTRDRLQLWAITELHQRGWRYHKIFQVWMAPYIEDRFSDNPRGLIGLSHEDSSKIWKTGVYIFFNYIKWDFFKAEFQISPGILTSDAETRTWAKPSWFTDSTD